MGVFPLADTLSFSFNPPWSHGVDWHAPPRHNAAAAVHAPIHYIAYPLALTRGPAPDPSARIHGAGPCIRLAPAVRTSDRTAGSAAKLRLQVVPGGLRHPGPLQEPGDGKMSLLG